MLPSQIQDKLSNSEKEYFQAYSSSLGQYMSTIDVDISVVCMLHPSHERLHDLGPLSRPTLLFVP